MIDLHPIRYGHVDLRPDDISGTIACNGGRDVDRPGQRAEVADCFRCHADAELRHDVVEETVEVVWSKQEYQCGV